MPHRVLVVEPDPAARGPILELLRAGGHLAVEATSLEQALEAIREAPVDLVISDVRPPNTDGVAFRLELQKVLPPSVPFIFLTASPQGDAVLLDQLVKLEYIFLKPPNIEELTRTVGALLGSSAREEGQFADEASFDRLLGGIAKQGDSGVLTAYRGPIVKKIVFEAGHITYCGSNDPKDLIGQALIKANLIEESDLREAMDAQAENTAPLGHVLQAMGKVTSQQMEQTVRRKFTDSILEMYTWDQGQWIYISGGITPTPSPQAIRLDVEALRIEGRRRAARWKELALVFSSDDMVLAVHPDKFPAGFPKNAGDKRLLQLAQTGRTLGQIRMELRGQDFAVFSRYAGFLKHGVVTIAVTGDPNPAAAKPEVPVATLIEAGRASLELSKLDAASEAFKEALNADPTNAFAREGLAKVAQARTREAAAGGLGPETLVRLLVPIQTLAMSTIDPSEAFLLSRLAAGPQPMRALFQVSPLADSDVIATIQKLVARKIVTV